MLQNLFDSYVNFLLDHFYLVWLYAIATITYASWVIFGETKTMTQKKELKKIETELDYLIYNERYLK